MVFEGRDAFFFHFSCIFSWIETLNIFLLLESFSISNGSYSRNFLKLGVNGCHGLQTVWYLNFPLEESIGLDVILPKSLHSKFKCVVLVFPFYFSYNLLFELSKLVLQLW